MGDTGGGQTGELAFLINLLLCALQSELFLLSCPLPLGPGPRLSCLVPATPPFCSASAMGKPVVPPMHIILMLGPSTFTKCSYPFPPGLSSSIPSSLF